MARYAINRSGIVAMEELKNNLTNAITDTLDSSTKLENTVNGLEGELGIYHEYIMLEITKVRILLKKALEGDDGIGNLVNISIPGMISYMEYLIDVGLGDGEPPQKVLKR